MKDEKGSSSVGGQFVKNPFSLALCAEQLGSSGKKLGTHFDFNTNKNVTRESAVAALKK